MLLKSKFASRKRLFSIISCLSVLLTATLFFGKALPVNASVSNWNPVTSLVDGKVYYIRNKHSGKYLDMEWGGDTGGTNIWQYSYTATHAQQFRLEQDSSGDWRIIPLSNEELCLDVQNSSNANEDNIWAAYAHEFASSLFKFQKNSDATYRILTKSSNYTKAVVVHNASTSDGANVFQYTYTSASPRNDDWELLECDQYSAMNWEYFFRGDNPPVNISTRYSSSHIGIDVPAPAGTDIYSTTNGTVWRAGYIKNMGNFVVIRSNQKDATNTNLVTRSMHMLTTPFVSDGAPVTKNTIIGEVGNTGEGSTANHLHFDVNNYNSWDGGTLRNNFNRTIQPELMFCDTYFTYSSTASYNSALYTPLNDNAEMTEMCCKDYEASALYLIDIKLLNYVGPDKADTYLANNKSSTILSFVEHFGITRSTFEEIMKGDDVYDIDALYSEDTVYAEQVLSNRVVM